MLKNITLSADDAVIEAARRRAEERQTTLNAEFRKWLEQFAGADQRCRERVERFDALLARTPRTTSGGRRFTRDEMNER